MNNDTETETKEKETFEDEVEKDLEAKTTDELFGSGSKTDDASEAKTDDEDFDESGLPLFDFAEPPEVKLKDGTACVFSIPTLDQEKKNDYLRVTTSIISPHKISGQNPVQETTEHIKADIWYFNETAKTLKGFRWHGEPKPRDVEAQEVHTPHPEFKKRDKTYAKAVPVRHKRSFVNRLYGGKIEVENLDGDGGGEGVAVGDDEILIVKHTMGVEANKDGSLTKPTHIVRYCYKTPDDYTMNRWNQVHDGYQVNIPEKDGGGVKQTSSLKTGKVVELSELLLVEVRGASFAGEPFDAKNPNHKLPAGVRRNSMVMAYGHWLKDVGNE